ncbi:arachidonate 5-lipoxygenase-like [Actinia tenebrosa]|uniref:Arachidonate 5-lipoxygenase-like n=1 Tax=Actinia tenebrosa TaxID=6105 RepID=A0A6P8I827_ACTTE|nr:arachidonate 5-lipoxygenase-like [Actinia tenebrosa]
MDPEKHPRTHLLLFICYFYLPFIYSASAARCPVSLPQKVTSQNPCYQVRNLALERQRSIYSLKPPSPLLPYARLNMTIPQYAEYLKTDPFLNHHAQLLIGLSQLNNKTLYSYMKATQNLPRIPELNEYAGMLSFFGDYPEKVFGEHVRRPSQYELFQSDHSTWLSDDFFTQQRLAGTNPMAIKQVTFSKKRGIYWQELKKNLNPNFNWQTAFQQVAGSCVSGISQYSLETAIEHGHIFAIRHPLSDNMAKMRDIATPPVPHPPREMWPMRSPISLFVSVPTLDRINPENKRKLKPIAIQMDYKPDSPVYTPRDGCKWTLAKLNVQLTDLAQAQLIEHLSKVHFTVEAFCVSLQRHLSEFHPLHIIMKYHCRGVITSNTFGAPVLVAPEGFVDQLYPVGWQGAFTYIQRASSVTNWEDLDFETYNKKRGIDDAESLPYFPYRDDGKLISDAIKAMVTDYINAFYLSDNDVRADNELQTYVSEISIDGKGPYGGTAQIKGFPPRVKSKMELIDIIHRFIWLMTGQHAAVSFPLSDYGIYPPNAPTKLYNDSRGPEGQFSIYNLPYRFTAAIQNRAFISLSSLRLDRLFDYGPLLEDSRAREVLYKHYSNLVNKVELVLDERNKNRHNTGFLTYPYLLPRWLPNGVQT